MATQPMKSSTLAQMTGLAIALTLLIVPALDAQPPRKATPKQTARILEDFNERIREIDALVLAGNGKKAHKEANRLLDEMTHGFISGDSISWYLGAVTLFRALAAHQLGNEQEALWHWHVATQLFPKFRDQDMTAYGDAGKFLAENPFPAEDSTESAEAEYRLELPDTIKPPKKKRTTQPAMPSAKRGSGRISVIVQAVIGTDGRPRQPRILESKGELTLVISSLDALRQWQFKPAERDGQPVEAYYNLAVNFVL